jgi:hypothetical protein
MKSFTICLTLFFTALLAQSNTSLEAVRKIRLENLERNYLNKTIRFYVPGSISVQGQLLRVTDENFIISEKNSPSTYSHKSIKSVFIDPGFNDLLMVFAISAIGKGQSLAPVCTDVSISLNDDSVGRAKVAKIATPLFN